MAVRIMQGDNTGDSQGAILYCSTTMWAFGPIFESAEQAQAFLAWINPIDPRSLTNTELDAKYSAFLEETKSNGRECA